MARAGLVKLFSGRPALRVMARKVGLSLVQQVADDQPDVVLVDLADERAAGQVRELARSPHSPAIVVLADEPHTTWRSAPFRAAVRAVLSRESTAEEVLATIEAVAVGLIVFQSDDMKALRFTPEDAVGLPRSGPTEPLTPREIEILTMIAEGLGNKIIAARLGISRHTVKFHIASILTKLKAGSRTEAVTVALRRGLIMI